MKENEAIQELESRISPYDTCKADFDANEAIKTAIKALEEVQQYRAIGTPEECRAAVEKQTAKKISSAWCPSCKKYLTTQHLKEKYHCVYCGQKLDWSDEE